MTAPLPPPPPPPPYKICKNFEVKIKSVDTFVTILELDKKEIKNKVISGSMTKVTCSMTKEELHHFHLVNNLLVKS